MGPAPPAWMKVSSSLAETRDESLRHEPLNAAATDRLADVEIALRVRGHGVREREVARLMTGSAESPQNRAQDAVEDPQNLVAAVCAVDVLLTLVGREVDVPRGPRCAQPRRPGVGDHGNDPLEVAGLVEHLV